MTIPSVLVVTSHFSGSERLGASVGALFTVMAAAGVAAPIAVRALYDDDDEDDASSDRNRALVYAAFVAAGALGTALFFPPPKSQSNNDNENAEVLELRRLGDDSEVVVGERSEASAAAKKKKKKTDCCIYLCVTSIEWRLLLSPSFLLLAVGSSLNLICMFNFYRLLPIVAAHSEGGDASISSSAAGLLSIVNAVDLFARLFSGWLGDRKASVECQEDSSFFLLLPEPPRLLIVTANF